MAQTSNIPALGTMEGLDKLVWSVYICTFLVIGMMVDTLGYEEKVLSQPSIRVIMAHLPHTLVLRVCL